MNPILEAANIFSPFFARTTAIMTAVIMLVIIMSILVSIERKINRGTVGLLIRMVWFTITILIILEGFLSYLEYTTKCG